MMVDDVDRAFFVAPVTRIIAVELQEEDGGGKDSEFVGLLRTYYHRAENLRVMVHGDDFISCGRRDVVSCFKSCLEARFEVKTFMIGHGPNDAGEGRVPPVAVGNMRETSDTQN